jgi:primase-polymerase (primpol)-like protein
MLNQAPDIYDKSVGQSTPVGHGAQDKPARPTAPPVNFGNIPEELKQRKQWTPWRYAERGAGWTKVPYMAWEAKKAWNSNTERREKWNKKKADEAAAKGLEWRERDRSTASSTDPETWATFEDAKRAYERSLSKPEYRYDGIGFALSGEVDENGLTIAAVDMDKVVGNPEREERARKIIAKLNSYTEISPSGKGYRIFLKAKPLSCPVVHDGLEFYAGLGRYLTVTGHVVGGDHV